MMTKNRQSHRNPVAVQRVSVPVNVFRRCLADFGLLRPAKDQIQPKLNQRFDISPLDITAPKTNQPTNQQTDQQAK